MTKPLPRLRGIRAGDLPRRASLVLAVLTAMVICGTWLVVAMFRSDADARVEPSAAAPTAAQPESTDRVASEAPVAPGALLPADGIGNLVPPDIVDALDAPTNGPTSTVAAAASGSSSATVTLDVQVVDGAGRPFARGVAGVEVCRNGRPQTVCPAGRGREVLDSDHDGHVQIELQAGSHYQVNAYVTGSGWQATWWDAGGTGYNLSDSVRIDVTMGVADAGISVTGDGSSAFPQFVIVQPVSVLVHVLDGGGQVLSTGMGGAMACVVDVTGDCPTGHERWRVAFDDNGDGIVQLGLDSGTDYRVQGIAAGTGWCNGWRTADGQLWHFGTTVSRATADQLQGTTFVVSNPCPSTSTTATSSSEPAPTATTPVSSSTPAPSTSSSVPDTTAPATAPPPTSPPTPPPTSPPTTNALSTITS